MTKKEDNTGLDLEHEKKLLEIIKRNEEENKELTETLKRLQAEFENYKKRTEKECAEFRKYSNAKLITKLLPILDSFELAVKNVDGDAKKGIELIYSQFFVALEDEGLRKIDSLNKKFNPYMHEVLLTGESKDVEEDTIIEELQSGYMLNESVLRHTKVKVAKNPKGDKK